MPAGYGHIRYAAVPMHEQAPELIELIQNSYAAVDLQFQYWLTITFAAVVASFLARNQLNLGLRLALVSLYALSALQIVLVSMAHLEYGSFLAAALQDLGVSPPITYLPAVGLVRRSVVGFGTIATIVFILRPDFLGLVDSGPSVDSREE